MSTSYKKGILFCVVLVLATLSFLYRIQLFELLKSFEQQKTMNPVLVACILILLKAIAPSGTLVNRCFTIRSSFAIDFSRSCFVYIN